MNSKDSITNKHKMKAMKQFTNQVKSNNNSPLQQGTPKQMQNKLAFPPKEKPKHPTIQSLSTPKCQFFFPTAKC